MASPSGPSNAASSASGTACVRANRWRAAAGSGLPPGATGEEFGTRMDASSAISACPSITVCFPDAPSSSMISVMDGVILPPELEQFAADAVAAGRYRDTAEVVQAGVRLLQTAEAEVAEFVASLEAAREESNRDGWVSLDDMLAEMDHIISETADRQA